MNECINWEKIIPNFQQGDVITPLATKFERQRQEDFIIDGGYNHNDLLEGCAFVKRKGSQKEGVYNQRGEQILPEEFDKCELEIYNSADFYATAIKVKKDGVYGLYNDNGQMIVPIQFIAIYLKDNFIVVQDKNKLYGAYMHDGRKVLDCEYDYVEAVGCIDEGLSYVKMSKKGWWGVTLETGKEVVPILFRRIEEGRSGYIVYDDFSKKSSRKGWYSWEGKYSIPCLFETIKFDYSRIYVKTPDGLKGIYSSHDGRELVPPKFETINFIGEFFIGLIGNDKLSVYDWLGNCLYSTTN